MPGDEPFRRFLMTVGITTDLPETGARIGESVDRMTRVFTGTFGYKRATSLDIDPDLEQIRKQIREFCLTCDEDCVVALYYTGHADDVNGKHRVWTGNTVDPVLGTLETGHLAELMLVGTRLRYALIILDTCFSGQGGAEALQGSLSQVAEGDGKILAVMTAAYPREQIHAGDFAELFERAVDQRAVAGHEPRYLTLGAITRFIDADPARPGWQTVSHSVLLARTDELPFFPNKRFNVQLHGLDLLTQLRIEQRELRIEEMRGHFLPRARGVDVPTEADWRFVGREAALRDLVSWLRDHEDLSVRVVTGGPGSGKSAVIARLVVLSDRDWRRTVPMDDLAADTIPPEGAIAAGIHARGMTSAQVLAAVCTAADIRADTPADLLKEMHGRRVTVAIDAIDEALDPNGLVSGILRPLVEAGPAEGLRLLLGTRLQLLESLGAIGTPVDLDDKRYADPASLYQYVLRGLMDQSPRSPFRPAPQELVEAVARAVAEAAGHSFLVALIVSRTLASAEEIPDPDDREWRADLPATAADAMHQDLETRLGAEADRARELLRPLAFAFGAGLPWDTVWAALSSQLSGHVYNNDDLMWVWQQAGSFVIEGKESGHSVYRLYHAALAEYLRQGCDERRIHRQFYDFLADSVPMSRSGPDWSRAHPYTRAHLATHAQRAGALDELLLNPRYLVNAVPAGLLAALPAARGTDAELAGVAYQRAIHQIRDQPEEEHRFSYLELAARIVGADELTRRLAADAPSRRWSVPWTHWPPEHPHRVLAGQLGQVNGILCIDRNDGNPLVASIGEDAKLRIWDVVTAEPHGTYTVGGAPLVAARAVRLPGYRTAIVLLAADGILYLWDIAASAVKWGIPTARSWRRLVSAQNPNLTLSCLTAPDGRPFAIVSGRGGRASIWDLSTGRLITFLPAGVTPEAVEFATLTNGKVVVIASLRGARRWMYDAQTGHVLPDKHRRIPFPWPRPIYNAVRLMRITYYALGGGTPVVAVRARFFRKSPIVWDLTDSNPLEAWPSGSSDAPIVQVRLRDRRIITIPPSNVEAAGSRRSQQPDKDPNTVVPLHVFANRPGQLDRKARESLSLQLEMRGRFLHVAFYEGLEKAGGRTISLTLAGHTADVTGYDWTRLSDGHVIVITASRDGTVRRWDVTAIGPESGEENEQARVALHRIVSVRLGDGTALGLTLAEGSSVALWDLRTGGLIGDLRWHTARQWAIGIAHPAIDTPIAVTFDTDGKMRLWNLPDCRLAAEFPVDRLRWPSDVAFTHLPDGTCIAVTSGHGRRIAVWDVHTGRIRNVLTGHKGWSACVACALGPGQRPIALTGGYDNRVNVWDLRRGRRRRHFRIVWPWTFLASPSAGRAHAMWTMPLDSGRVVALVATSDGVVRALEPRRFPWGVRRLAVVPADAVATAVLSNGLAIVTTAGQDGIVRIWKPEFFTDGSDDNGLLCEINIEVPVSDISFVDRDTFVVATPNGLTAIQLDAALLEK